MGKDTGPFGAEAEVGVGLSDVTLLAVSILGFIMLAITVYSIIMARLQTSEELDGKMDDLDYDEQLARADVSTLNRAQRRARAKNLMKNSRRIAPSAVVAEQQQNANEDEAGVNDGEQMRHLSRKERAAQAKAAERLERRVDEERRRTINRERQEAAQSEKREREQLEAERVEMERQLREQQKRDQEQAEYDSWKTFLSADGGETMTVKQFRSYSKTQQVVNVEDLAEKFRVPSSKVSKRIKELQSSNRITGVLNENGQFIYISSEDMSAAANYLRQNGRIISLNSNKQC